MRRRGFLALLVVASSVGWPQVAGAHHRPAHRKSPTVPAAPMLTVQEA